MKIKFQQFLRHLKEGNMITLFLSLLFLIISFPFFEFLPFLFPLFSFILLVGILGSSLSQRKTILFFWALFLFLFSFTLTFSDHIFIAIVFILGTFLLLWLIASKLIHVIFSATIIHTKEVVSALSLYLVVGISFAFSVLLLGKIDPASFSEKMKWGNSLYYSFVTMSTLGYGDILPQSHWAMDLAIIQVLFGVFFTTTVLALLVGKYSRR